MTHRNFVFEDKLLQETTYTAGNHFCLPFDPFHAHLNQSFHQIKQQNRVAMTCHVTLTLFYHRARFSFRYD